MIGWRTNRRIIVFESDDWGGIRMPDLDTYNNLLSKGLRVYNCPFSKYDSLASEEDLSMLFEVLSGCKDIHGNNALLTANSIMANPDFEKIKSSGFREYHYELFTETLNKYPHHKGSFKLWKEGIEKKLFRPQFHGREHLYVERWMNALRMNLPETMIAFNLQMFGIGTTITSEKRKSYLAAFDIDRPEDVNPVKEYISEGLQIFIELFGYSSKSFVAPNFFWPSWLEKVLFDHGVLFLQTQRNQILPDIDSGKVKKIPHYTGQRNKYGQIYTVRNCIFEPSLYPKVDSLNTCLSHINDAFRWGKPAIISTHRVNFIGSIVKSNRDNNL